MTAGEKCSGRSLDCGAGGSAYCNYM